MAVGLMGRQLDHMVRLVDDLMEVSRITRGNVELRQEPVRLDVALRNAIDSSEPLIRAGSHRLNVSMPQSPMVLEADSVRVAQDLRQPARQRREVFRDTAARSPSTCGARIA